MKITINSIFFVVYFLVSGSCSVVDGESGIDHSLLGSSDVDLENFGIVTDRSVYEIDDGVSVNGGVVVSVKYRYFNRGQTSYFLGGCIGSPLGSEEKLVDNKWTSVTYRVCVATPGLDTIIEVSPNSEIEVDHMIIVSSVQAPGVFRMKRQIFLVWDEKVYRESGGRGNYPFETLYSNAFEIR